MKRNVALGAAWTVSAAAAVGLGLLATSLVDASASPGTSLAAATTAPSSSSSHSSSSNSSSSSSSPSSSSSSSAGTTSRTSAPAGTAATGEYATAGGTVYADCANGSPVLAGVPAAGWYVDDSDDPGELEFKSGGDQKVEVHVVCVGGAPVFGLDDSSSRSSASSAPASATSGHDRSGRDDSSGRSGGGHGSDDGPGDDSSGRSGGGHGSDD